MLDSAVDTTKDVWEDINEKLSSIVQRYKNKPKVLLVEDGKDRQTGLIMHYLLTKGFEVTPVSTIQDFVSYLKSGSYDCILISITEENKTTIQTYLKQTKPSSKAIGLLKKKRYKDDLDKGIFDLVYDTTDLKLPELSVAIKRCIEGSGYDRQQRT